MIVKKRMSHSISFLVSDIFCHDNIDSITLTNRVDLLRPQKAMDINNDNRI